MRNANVKQMPLSTEPFLKTMLRQLAQTFLQKASLSDEQVESYRIALADINESELRRALPRVLREWTFASMLPPPAVIREAVAAELEVEELGRAKKKGWRNKAIIPEPRLTLEEAWDEWIEIDRIAREMREKFGIKQPEKTKPKSGLDDLAIASHERMRLLQQQKVELERKYGKGKAVRVRGSVPPKTDEGAGGAE